MVKNDATFWHFSISSFEVINEVFLNHVCSKMVFCKGELAQLKLHTKCAFIFTAYLCVLVNLISLLQLSDDLEQKENSFNHLGEEAESKIKQCRTNSSLRSVLRPGKGGPFELSDKHGHLNVVKWLYRTILWVIILIYMKLYIWKVKSRKMVVF